MGATAQSSKTIAVGQIVDEVPSFSSEAGPAPLPPEVIPISNPQDLIDYDRWLVLEAELTPLAPKIKEQAELRKKILARFPNLAPNVAETVNGTYNDIWISPCDNARTITDKGKRALHKLWGLRLFRLNAGFTLGQLPDPKDPQGLYTVNGRTGPRHLKALPRLKPAA